MRAILCQVLSYIVKYIVSSNQSLLIIRKLVSDDHTYAVFRERQGHAFSVPCQVVQQTGTVWIVQVVYA